jgi:hypothetical protein
MKLEFSRQIFEKYINNKFHENPYIGSRVVPCGRPDGQADTTQLTAVFRNFANAPKTTFWKHLIQNIPFASKNIITTRTFQYAADH